LKVWRFLGSHYNIELLFDIKFTGYDVHSCGRIKHAGYDCIFAATGNPRHAIERFDLLDVEKSGMPKRSSMEGHKGFVEVIMTTSQQVFSGGSGGEIRQWDKNGKETGGHSWTGHSRGFRVIGLSADASRIFSIAVRENSAKSESLHVRARKGIPCDGPSELRAWSRDGQLLSIFQDCNPRAFLSGDLWSHKGIVYTATADGIVELWNGETGNKLTDLDAHFQGVLSALTVTGPPVEEHADNSALGEPLPDSDEESDLDMEGQPSLQRTRSEQLKSAFHQNDLDKNGKLTRRELRAMLKTSDAEAGVGDHFLDIILNSMDQDEDGKISFDEFVDFIYSTKRKGGAPPPAVTVIADSPVSSERDRSTASLKLARVSIDGGAVQRPRSEPDGATRSLGRDQQISIRDQALAKAAARRGIPLRRPSVSPSPRR